MKTSSGKENVWRIIVTGITFFIVLILTFVTMIQIDKKIEENSYRDLREAALVADVKMNSLVEDTFFSLDCIGSVYISHYQGQEADDVAKSITGSPLGFLSMSPRLYLPDGRIYAEGHELENVSEAIDINGVINEMQDDRMISACKKDSLSLNTNIIEFYRPLKSRGEVIGIISAALNVDKLPEYMTPDSFDGQSDLMFLDGRDGIFFLDTFHSEINTVDNFDDRIDKTGDSVKPFFEEILAGSESHTTLQSQSTGKILYLYSVPSKVDGWHSIIFVDEQVVFEESTPVNRMLIVLTCLECVVFLIYLIWIVVSVKRQVINDSKSVVSQMMGDDGLFLIDIVNNTRKTIYNYCAHTEDYTDEEKATDSFKKYVDNYVVEADREKVILAMDREYMMERLSIEPEYTVQYRDTSLGIQRFFEMKIAKFSKTEVLQSFKEKDREIIGGLISEKLKEDYFALWGIDLDSGLFQALKDSPNHKLGEPGDVLQYVPTIKKLASFSKGELRDFFIQIGDLGALRRVFEFEDKASKIIKADDIEGVEWISVMGRVLTRNSDNTPSLVALEFTVLDENASRDHELREQLREDMQMIGGLASEYHTLYYYNMDANIFKVYSLDGKKYPELVKYVDEHGDPLKMLSVFGHSDLIHPDDRHLFKDITVETVRKNLAHSKKYSIRFRRLFDSEYLWTEMDIIKYENIDEMANVVAIGFAVRDKEIRTEKEKQQELRDARNAAEAANVSKTNFLFSMSHDIRTPMNAIMGFTTMAKKYIQDKDRVAEYLDKIDISGQQLLMLINQVLEMARIETGKIELNEGPVNVNEQFYAIATVLSEQVASNGLTLQYSIEDIVHENVYADEARMGSIAFNILGNAMKYTPEGGNIDYSLREISPRKDGYATYIFTVEDSGIGMSEEYLKVLFEPFSRENNSTVSKIQGTGLGMSIVKSLVDRMGGEIEVHSEVGKGTRFDVTLDFKIVGEGEVVKQPAAEYDAKSFDGVKVLVVEDNEMNREIAKAILETRGFTVDVAYDGDIAVGIIKKKIEEGNPGGYDCILMDIQMPQLNGYAATRIIRDMLRPTGVSIPIIAMTANVFEEDRKNAFRAGMDDHVSKPIDVKILMETLAKHILEK